MHFKKEVIAGIRTILDSSKYVVILTHQNPDGDTLGGAFALYYYLRNRGISSTIICYKNFSNFFRWMMYGAPKKDFFQLKNIASIDSFILVDHCHFSRSEKTSFSVENHSAQKIIIDHHLNLPDMAKVQLVDTTAEATCKMIYQLIEDLGETHLIDEQVAACLYAGIITDTGNFTHGKNSISLFQVVIRLIEKGIKPNEIYNEIYHTSSFNKLRLLGYVLLEKICLSEQDKIAYITLNSNELERFNYQVGDTEDMVNYPFSIKGVEVSLLIMEIKTQVRISFRSKGKIPVNQYAEEYFNGGGHLNAAGATSNKPLKEVLNYIKKTLPGFLSSLKKK